MHKQIKHIMIGTASLQKQKKEKFTQYHKTFSLGIRVF